MAQLGARFHGMEEVVSSNLTRSTKFLKQLQTHSPVDLPNWVQTGSKPKLICHGGRGIRGIRGALFFVSRDGDNIVFPYTCRIGPSPPWVPSAVAIRLVAAVLMGCVCSRFACRETETISFTVRASGPRLPARHRLFETTRQRFVFSLTPPRCRVRD